MAGPADLNLDFLPEDQQGIYLVGGTVRDLLMAQRPSDIDLAVKGNITRTAERIANKTAGRIVDLGKREFAVLRVVGPTATIDITPLDGTTIEADLERRDFTINALAYDVNSRRLVDCTGGQDDIRRKIIRMVSPSAFQRDPARLVRAYRMAAALDFSINAGTRRAIARDGHLVNRIAGERIWAELLKLFTTADSTPVIRDMAANGLLTQLFPELRPAVGCTQNRHHAFDVFTHSLQTYEELERLLARARARFSNHVPDAELTDLSSQAGIIKYAALLHDVGKPATRRIDGNGQVRFPGHALRSAEIAASVSRRLRLSRKQHQTADAIIRHHIRSLFLYLAAENGSLSHRGMVRFFNHCADLTFPVIVHTMADIKAKGPVPQARDTGFLAFCDRLLAAYGDYHEIRDAGPPLISGRDLISFFGLPPSPRFKEILRLVDERRLSGELATKDDALAWVGSHILRKEKKPESEDGSRNGGPLDRNP